MKYSELINDVNFSILACDTYTVDGGEPKSTKELWSQSFYFDMYILGIRKINGALNVDLRTKMFYDLKTVSDDENYLTIEFKYLTHTCRIKITKCYDDDGTLISYEDILYYDDGYSFYYLTNGEFKYEDETDEYSSIHALAYYKNVNVLKSEIIEFINSAK